MENTLRAVTTEDLMASLQRWADNRSLGGDSQEFAIAVAMELQSRIGLNAYTNRLMVWLNSVAA
jgi:hypothetical protein